MSDSQRSLEIIKTSALNFNCTQKSEAHSRRKTARQHSTKSTLNSPLAMPLIQHILVFLLYDGSLFIYLTDLFIDLSDLFIDLKDLFIDLTYLFMDRTDLCIDLRDLFIDFTDFICRVKREQFSRASPQQCSLASLSSSSNTSSSSDSMPG